MSAKNILLVSEQDKEAIKAWTLEIRELFDPRAAHELDQRIEEEQQRRRAAAADDEVPF